MSGPGADRPKCYHHERRDCQDCDFEWCALCGSSAHECAPTYRSEINAAYRRGQEDMRFRALNQVSDAAECEVVGMLPIKDLPCGT